MKDKKNYKKKNNNNIFFMMLSNYTIIYLKPSQYKTFLIKNM